MNLYRAQERLILAKLLIDLNKTIHKGRLGKRFHSTIAGEVELILIAAAVLVGYVQGHPRNAAELSRQLGIPRPTIVRKLARLIDHGIIERVDGHRYVTTDNVPGDDYSYVDHALHLIKDAAKKIPAT